MYYDNNIIFDYYRNSFILSTRTLLITEKSSSIDYNIEDVRMDYLKMGVVVPTHFDRLVIIEKEFSENAHLKFALV